MRLLATGFAVGADAVEPPQFFSRDAVAFVKRAGLEGPVFNSHNLGGYLAWTLYPQVRVFQDSRLQAYPPEHFRSIILASRSQQEWNVLVADVDWAVLSVPRPNQLSGDGRFPVEEWGTVFSDEAMEIVVRRSGRYTPIDRPSLGKSDSSGLQPPASRNGWDQNAATVEAGGATGRTAYRSVRTPDV